MEKEVQRRKKGKMLSTNTRKKKEKRDPLSTISVSSAWHLPEVLWFFFSPCPAQAQIKKKKGQRAHQLTEVSNTCLSLHIFCQLRLAPVPGSDLKKKRKVRSTLRNFCQLGLAPARSSLVFFFSPCPAQAQERKKKKKNWSQQSLPLSLHNLCKLGLTPARSSDLKKRKVRSLSAISVSSA